MAASSLHWQRCFGVRVGQGCPGSLQPGVRDFSVAQERLSATDGHEVCALAEGILEIGVEQASSRKKQIDRAVGKDSLSAME